MTILHCVNRPSGISGKRKQVDMGAVRKALLEGWNVRWLVQGEEQLADTGKDRYFSLHGVLQGGYGFL